MDQRSSKEVLILLSQQYDWLKELTKPLDFFVAVADYVKLIKVDPVFNKFAQQLEEDRKRQYKLLDSLHLMSFRELQAASERVLKIVKDAKLFIQPILEAQQELERVYKGLIHSSEPFIHLIDNHLFDIAIALNQEGKSDMIKDFEDPNKEPKNIFGNYTFSNSLQQYDKEAQKVNERRKTEMWGAWEKLPAIYEIVFHGDRVDYVKWKNLDGKVPSERDAIKYLLHASFEFGTLRRGQTDGKSFVVLRVDDFKGYIQRLHRYLTSEVVVGGHLEDNKEDKASFDSKDGILAIGKNKIKFFKIQLYVIDLIFSEPTKEWSFDEMSGGDDLAVKHEVKRYINAAYQLNRKIILSAGINDFFIKRDSTSLKINPKYLT